jgi:hypothetical protein
MAVFSVWSGTAVIVKSLRSLSVLNAESELDEHLASRFLDGIR